MLDGVLINCGAVCRHHLEPRLGQPVFTSLSLNAFCQAVGGIRRCGGGGKDGNPGIGLELGIAGFLHRGNIGQALVGKSIASIATALGIPKAGLGNRARLHAQGGLVNTASSPKNTSTVTSEQMELARLRTANARLRMERDIARKTAAYFVM